MPVPVPLVTLTCTDVSELVDLPSGRPLRAAAVAMTPVATWERRGDALALYPRVIGGRVIDGVLCNWQGQPGLQVPVPLEGWTYRLEITAEGRVLLSANVLVDSATPSPSPLTNVMTASAVGGTPVLVGRPGASAYESFVAAGFTGSEAEWRESLRGAASMARGQTTNLDTLTGASNAGSWYRSSTATGAPTARLAVVIVASQAVGGVTAQTDFDSAGEVRTRLWNGSSWSSWRRMDVPDTGWRDITANVRVDALSPSNTGRLLVRRTLSDLRYWFDNLLIAPGSGGLDLIATGLGGEWRPNGSGFGQVGRNGQAYDMSQIACYSWQVSWRNVLPTGQTSLTLTRPTTGLVGSFVLPCDGAFPTGALPGTA